jgi:hypothetical protein
VSGRFQPEAGADSPQALVGYVNPDGSGEGNWAEPVHWEDQTCDYCSHPTLNLIQQQHGGSIAWLCERCVERDRQRYEESVA